MQPSRNAGSKQFIGKLRPDLSAYVYTTVLEMDLRAQIFPRPLSWLIAVRMYMSPDGAAVRTEEPGTAYPNARERWLPISRITCLTSHRMAETSIFLF